MPAVFVNGNPESAAIWDPLLAELDRTDVLRLSPPGFGAPIPDGFGCTVIGLPGLAHRGAGGTRRAGRPGRARRGRQHRRRRRHDQARPAADLGQRLAWACSIPTTSGTTWPTAGRHRGSGEKSVAELLGRHARRAHRAHGRLGHPAAGRRAARPAPGPGDGPGHPRLLPLRRPAGHGRGWASTCPPRRRAPAWPSSRPRTTSWAPTEMRRRSAARAGARVEALDGLGHWWMVQDPGRSARALASFWAQTA